MPEDQASLRRARHADLQAALDRQPDGVSRRRFLELLGASLALTGAAACANPRDKIVPYVRTPQDVQPGTPLYFATAHVLGGFADGVLVESHEGRPTKVEGNPQHPASLGATDVFAQASLLTLYEPTRSQTPTFQGQIRTWLDFVRDMRATLAGVQATGGAGLRILTESVTSPSLAAQIQQVLNAFPGARWHRWQPVNRDNVLAGAALAFGTALSPRYRFDAANVVLSLDADPLADWEPGHVRYSRDLASRRQPERGALNRIYAVENTWSSLGSVADHRLALQAAAIEPLAWSLAAALGVNVPSVAPPANVPAEWLAAAVDDLRAAGANGLVLAGPTQPPAVHALAHAMNSQLGSIGTTVELTDPIEADPVQHAASLRELTDALAGGGVDVLLILGGNPAYTASADIPFASNLRNVRARSVYLGMFDDETADLCHWHLPALHPLETWGDARAYDGTATVMQPLIAPLYQGWSPHEVLAALGDQPDTPAHNTVKGYWQSQMPSGDFESTWRGLLHDGVVPGTAASPRSVTLSANWSAGISPPTVPPGNLEVVLKPDPALYDGRFANNGWLLEVPRPFTRVTWDNVALFSPATAERFVVENGDVVELRLGSASVRAPVWTLPGHADDSVTVTLGYGRRRGAGAGNGVGFDVSPIRSSTQPWFASGLQVVKTGEKHALASTQGVFDQRSRDLVQSITRADWERGGKLVEEKRSDTSLYPAYSYPGNAWGMVIDQSACTGCNACIVACQAENNIPVVGQEEVARGRAMHWLRLDTYFEEDQALRQLVPCMHCETAPCEVVCPVGATVHSDEGLNDMVYNRCVGTRYCSNNCPYKVRHFNFFQYSDFSTPSFKLGRNPEVTVRERGVMEKCTYCVQRISAARIQAEREDRPIRDGEVVTACQAACPAGAIVFGNLNDAGSEVAKARSSPRTYTLLGELNTRPRTTYQAVVRNPNPRLSS